MLRGNNIVMKKLTLAEWELLENGPAIVGVLHAYVDSPAEIAPGITPMCAGGKVGYLVAGEPYPGCLYLARGRSAEQIDVWNSYVALNNCRINGVHMPIAEAYHKDHPNWNRHVQAFRSMLMLAVEAGYIELENDLAQELANRSQELGVGTTETKEVANVK
jgi:hypothetical protein